MAYLTSGFTFLCALIYLVFNFCNYKYRKAKHLPWNGLHFTTKNITYIAMMIAVSVSLTVVISVTIPITVFPPIRVAFSGIMVKITGMFFGPIVGIIVGALTEALCLMFVPSYIHIAYFCVSISFGFWAGVASYTTSWRGERKWITFALINAYLVVFTIVMYFIQIHGPMDQDTKFFGITIPKEFTPIFFIIMMGSTLALIWIVTGILMAVKKSNWLEVIFPVIFLCIVTETLATILLASWGDSEILGIPAYQGGYSSMVLVRLMQTPLKVAFNTAVLSTVYTVMRPILRKK